VAEQQTPITIDDLYQLGWIEDPALSPDGSTVAFVRVTVDRTRNRYRRTIWLASTQQTDGSPRLRRLTTGPRSDTAPCWRPDGGAIAFVSDRDGDRPQIYVIPADGGEARRLTSALWGASAPAWRPDGRALAFLSRLTVEERQREDSGKQVAPPSSEWERQQQKASRTHDEEQRFDPRVITKIPFRSGTTFFDGRKAQIYLIDVPADDDAEPGSARRLTDDETDFGAPAWLPDGWAIISTAGRDPDADTLFGDDDIVRVPIPAEGRAPIVRLTSDDASYDSPKVSEDGRWIAARRRDAHRPLSRGASVVVIPAEGGEPRDLTAASDRNVESFCWGPDDQAILFSAPWWGEETVYAAYLEGGEVAPLHEKRTPLIISEFDAAQNGRIAFVAGSDTNPSELYLWQPDGTQTQLTSINQGLLGARTLAPFEELRYNAPDGTPMQGWVIYPPDFTPSKTYPLAVHIHGGPHLMWAPGVRSMWHELQTTAASGYITFFCNPRGSDGYGEAWRDGVHGDWGSAGADILAGVDTLLKRGQIDTQRMAVTGGSYGGYMTTWLIAHDQRFICAVAARGVYDLISFHGTSDAHELIEFEFDGMPWEQRDLLWEQSPLSHAHQITTPLLILHAELDFRVPISQAEQLFSNLRRRKIPTELVRYPREGHELTRSGEPDHRADHMRRTLGWFERFCSQPT
jgi:dipeptidyl aminopeptidase/acylaminoacyl peptidase